MKSRGLRIKIKLFKICFKVTLACSFIFVLACTKEPVLPATSITESAISLSAEAGANQTVDIGDVVRLDATASIGRELDYHWLFRVAPQGTQSSLLDSESANPSFIVDHVGTYVLQLYVLEGMSGGASKDAVSIRVISEAGDTATVDVHDGVRLSCASCHNEKAAKVGSLFHLSASGECVFCHATTAWVPAINIDHAELVGICSRCHNGGIAPAKPASHIDTADECNECHNPGLTFKIYASSSMARHQRGQAGGFKGTRFLFNADSWVNSKNNRNSGNIRTSDNSNDDGDSGAGNSRADDDGGGSEGTGAGNDDGDSGANSGGGSGGDNHPNVDGRLCTECHTQPSRHFPTTDRCRACHTTADWERIITVDHAEVIGGCDTCHQKPAGHIVTTVQCNTCHNTNKWTPLISGGGAIAVFDHTTLPPGAACVSCHNGGIAKGKPSNHPVTSNECGTCHDTLTFSLTASGPFAPFDHSKLAADVSCSGCHDGLTAVGKSQTHIVTNSECNVCHTTTAFVPAGGGAVSVKIFNHRSLDPAAACKDCHNGSLAIGKPSKHLITISRANLF